MASVNVRDLQSPIRQRYTDDPCAADIKVQVKSAQAGLGDPLHCVARPASVPNNTFRSGPYPGVGGSATYRVRVTP